MYSRRNALLGAAGLLTACGAKLHHFPFDYGQATQGGLSVTYFSVGCTLIRCGNRSILTDPFWSHRPLTEVAALPLRHDIEEIDKHRSKLNDVLAVLVGHGHYDHCLDLDQITGDIQPQAAVYGSETLTHIFAKSAIDKPIVAVNQLTATPERPGEWLYSADRSLRVLPILSGHPNQWLCFHFFKEKLKTDLEKPPRFAWDYQEGISLAFLVDFLDANAIEKRVYIQTSSTGWPAGFFPKSILDEANVDLAVLSMDCANIKRQGITPAIIDYLTPKTILFCHWEDFFLPKSGIPREIVKVDLPDLKQFFKSTTETKYLFPGWNSSFQL